MLNYATDYGEAVVIDNGSHSLKIGYCGEDLPRSVIPAVKATVERRRELDDAAGGYNTHVKTEVLLGKEVWKATDEETFVTTPIKYGTIVEKEALEELWQFAINDYLSTDANCLTVLATYPPLSSLSTLEWMLSVFFEKFHCERFALLPSAPLSLFSTGRSRGLVVEVGNSITSAVPVYEGFSLAYSTFRMFRSGSAVTTALWNTLQENRLLRNSPHLSNTEIIEEMKHKLCGVAVPDLQTQVQGADMSSFEERAFQLPDGSVIELDQKLRYGPAELLFDSSILREDLSSVPDIPRLLQSELRSKETVQGLVYAAVLATDLVFQREMKQNIVLAGGSSLLKGFCDRLLGELLCLESTESNSYAIVADGQRNFSAWTGGSMFASLTTFPLFCMSRQEYEDSGGEYVALMNSKSLAR